MKEYLDRTKLLHKKILNILLKEWDPIGIQDVPEAQDEYDAYVVSMYKLLVSHKPEHEIFDYLWWVETQHMGLPGDMQRTKAVAKQLAALIDSSYDL